MIASHNNNFQKLPFNKRSLESAIRVLKKCASTGFSGEIKLNFHKGDMSKKIKKTETIQID